MTKNDFLSPVTDNVAPETGTSSIISQIAVAAFLAHLNETTIVEVLNKSIIMTVCATLIFPTEVTVPPNTFTRPVIFKTTDKVAFGVINATIHGAPHLPSKMSGINIHTFASPHITYR